MDVLAIDEDVVYWRWEVGAHDALGLEVRFRADKFLRFALDVGALKVVAFDHWVMKPLTGSGDIPAGSLAKVK